jgi:hypothetical protein
LKGAILGLFFIVSTAVFARQQMLPIPPIPPEGAPPQDAPIPDFDAPIPFDAAIGSAVIPDLAINHRPAPASGYGYMPGARYQIDNDRRLLNVPGILWRLPLP